jgi:hypothetical protein
VGGSIDIDTNSNTGSTDIDTNSNTGSTDIDTNSNTGSIDIDTNSNTGRSKIQGRTNKSESNRFSVRALRFFSLLTGPNRLKNPSSLLSSPYWKLLGTR